jgi:acyl carrier protein
LTDIKEQVRSFVRTNFYLPDGVALGDSASLLAQGIIDSTGVLELVTFIEEAFGIDVGDSEMVPQNLDSIDGIARFVANKRG